MRENSNDQSLKDAQEEAKSAGRGLWGSDSSQHVRNITWELENPRQLVDRMGGKPVQAVIEHVRDGTTIRAFLLPDFYHVTLMMSGVRVRISARLLIKFFVKFFLFSLLIQRWEPRASQTQLCLSLMLWRHIISPRVAFFKETLRLFWNL